MSRSARHGHTRASGDEAELFRDFHPQLIRIIRSQTSSAHELVEDACASAWVHFMKCQPARDRNWRGWLVTTAQGGLGGYGALSTPTCMS